MRGVAKDRRDKYLKTLPYNPTTSNECESCKTILPLDNFTRLVGYSWNSICIPCESVKLGYDVTTYRKCGNCKVIKELNNFSLKGIRKDGTKAWSNVCTTCLNNKAKERNKNPAIQDRIQRYENSQHRKDLIEIANTRNLLLGHDGVIDEDILKRFNSDVRRIVKLRRMKRQHDKDYATDLPFRNRSRHIMKNAIRQGVLIRKPCEAPGCGLSINPNGKAIAGHHPDYNKPLEVIWLCNKHHDKEHNKLRKELLVSMIIEVDNYYIKLDKNK